MTDSQDDRTRTQAQQQGQTGNQSQSADQPSDVKAHRNEAARESSIGAVRSGDLEGERDDTGDFNRVNNPRLQHQGDEV